MVTITLNGTTVASSKNLRGILSYARKHPVQRVEVLRSATNGKGLVSFLFADGATCATEWEDASVAVEWIDARRSWKMHTERFGSGFWHFAARSTFPTVIL